VTTSSTLSDSGELPGAPKLATARDVTADWTFNTQCRPLRDPAGLDRDGRETGPTLSSCSFCGNRRSCYVWDDKVGFLRQRRAAGEVVRAWIEQQDAAGEVGSRPGAGLRG
jgi:hypothetical protein